MKRSFISLGLIVAATFALTNCTKDIENPSDKPETAGIPFEIIASTADTKTTNDGLNTNWAADDAINLFHVEAGATTDYTNDGEFSVADTETGRFTGTLASDLTASAYDWYAFYPYNSFTTTPANNSAGRTYIGCRSDEVQTQDGLNNMNHIDGDNYPLYGYAKNVSKDAKPELSMKHVSSLLKVVVTNTLSEPLEVEDVSFTAPESIVGYYYVNFSTDPCTFTEYNTYQSNTAVLEVSNAVIPAGKTGEFYLAIKPFTAVKDSKLYLSVNGYQKDITLPTAVTFESGKIKTLKFSYDKDTTNYAEYTIEWDNANDWMDNSTKLISGYYTVQTAKNTGSTPPTVNGTSNDCRVYAKGSVTISHSSANIKRLVFNLSDQGIKRLSEITPSVGNVTIVDKKVIWEGDAMSVTFTVGDKAIYGTDGSEKAGQLCFDSIDAVADKSDAPIVAVLKSIAIADMTTEYDINDVFSFDGKLTATYTDNSTKEVSPTDVSDPDMTTGGTKKITVTYTEGDVTLSQDYFIEVKGGQVLPTTTETINCSELGYSNGVAVPEIKIGDVNVTLEKGTNNQNPPKYYDTGSAIRAYGGNKLTFTSSKTITKVVFTFASGEGANAITANPGDFVTDTWTGSANTVVFTVAGSSGHRRIASISVTYQN